MLIPRRSLERLRQALARQASVALLGPRQVGKTTLALKLAEFADATYLDFERTSVRVVLEDVDGFFRSQEGRLVIFDEVHRVPEIFSEIGGVIDRSRRRGIGTGLIPLSGVGFHGSPPTR